MPGTETWRREIFRMRRLCPLTWTSPVLLLVVQQSLQVPGASLRLAFLVLQGASPSLPLPLLLQQLVVQGLQLHHLLLQHAACRLQSLNVLRGMGGGVKRLSKHLQSFCMKRNVFLCKQAFHLHLLPVSGC